jgi:hypothetical protein
MKGKDEVLRAMDEADNQLYVVQDLIKQAAITGQEAIDRIAKIRLKLSKAAERISLN